MRQLLLATLAIAVALVFGEAEACWRRRASAQPSAPLTVTELTDGSPLVLGNDLTVRYRVAPGAKFSNIKLRVANRMGELVYLSANLPASVGRHDAVWPRGAWNQAPHSGALANPRNGPYLAALVAEATDGTSFSCTFFVSTQLVLQTDLEHDRPSKDEISSGLYRPMLDAKSPDRLRLGLVREGSKLADTVYARAAPAFSAIVEEDLDNDPRELEVKSVHVRQVMQSTFPDGVYHVVLTNLRTGAGGRGVAGMPDGIIETWTIRLR